MSAETQTRRLIELLATLRDPQSGCPWDQAQNFASIAPYTIEEAYEVVDAIARNDHSALADELGDLLLQVVYHCRIAEEAELFTFEDVAQLISEKLIRRHPYLFGQPGTPDKLWEDHKERERRKMSKIAGVDYGTLAGIPVNLPALTRAQKLTSRAARVGFDWPEVMQVVEKLEEELDELRKEIPGGDPSRMEDELGDILFTAANLARKLKLDAEACLRRASEKFERRFNSVERKAGMSLHESSLEQMEALWQQAKLEV